MINQKAGTVLFFHEALFPAEGSKLTPFFGLLFFFIFILLVFCQANATEVPMQGNHLIHESSPYLLQHAHNPVDWYPWGKEAFAKARLEDKPILLSIGYSTCHWCHVMEEESYSNPEVGKVLNADFIAIKVDREERPDIDQVYMQAAQMMTGSGGWPLNILMTPDKRPFFAATYLPRHTRFGRIGLVELAERVHNLWQHDRAKLLQPVAQLEDALTRMNKGESDGVAPDKHIIDSTYQHLVHTFDAKYGGFGGAPKFPSPQNLLFLLRYWHQTGDRQALLMVETTLTAMRAGGIFDQIGFGFHRYSTDDHWLLPHFEKMLYDQAMLIMAYAETYQATGKQAYAQTARDIITYVTRDMRDTGGGFYSAEDADSAGVEGKFYIWTQQQMETVLGRKDAAFAASVFGVSANGNVKDEATGETTGANVLHLAHPPVSEADRARLERIRKTLFAARATRVRPFRDDKILTDWNAMMIAALAIAARALNAPEYAVLAHQSATFLLQHLRRKDGRLLHRFRKGKAGIQAKLDDYAYLVWGMIELYETDFHVQDLQTAMDLNANMLEHFESPQGGLYFTADDAQALLVRPMTAYDGAIPSGNSIAMMNLIRLARMTGNTKLEQRAADIIGAFSKEVKASPSAFTYMMSAFMFAENRSYEVVLAGNRDSTDGKAMLHAIRKHFIPNKVVLWQNGTLARIAPYTKLQKAIGGKATAYICENFQCNLPVTDPQQALKEMLLEPRIKTLTSGR